MGSMDFGQRVLTRRKELGIGQSELARTARVSRQVVYQWETTGTKPEKIEVVLAVAAALKTSISFLYGETDNPKPAPEWHTGQGPSTEWEALVAAAREKLAEADAILALDPVKQELKRIASTSARGSSLHPEAAQPVQSAQRRAKAQ